MEIIKNFGINPYLLLGQIVNFLVLLFLLKKYAFKPILKLLNDRKQTIEEGLKNSLEAQKLLEEALKKEKEVLTKAEKNADQILKEAKNEAVIIVENAREYSKKETERLIVEARVQMAVDYKEAEKRLATKTYSLALQVLKESLFNFLPNELQKTVIEKFLKKQNLKNK